MDAKTIVAVVLVAFIIGGFIFLQIYHTHFITSWQRIL